MPAKKKISSPLQLLQQLSHSLVEHLAKACADAHKEAEGLLAKLEKQRGKARDKLIRARSKLEDAGAAGKSRAQSKARARIEELEDALALLDVRQRETLDYLRTLERDTRQSLELAEGIRQVGEAAGQTAMQEEGSAAPARKPQRSGTASSGRKPAQPARPASVIETATAPVARKPRPPRAAASKVNPVEAITLPDGETAAAVAPKPAVQKPARVRKPAVRKPPAAQGPVSSS